MKSWVQFKGEQYKEKITTTLSLERLLLSIKKTKEVGPRLQPWYNTSRLVFDFSLTPNFLVRQQPHFLAVYNLYDQTLKRFVII